MERRRKTIFPFHESSKVRRHTLPKTLRGLRHVVFVNRTNGLGASRNHCTLHSPDGRPCGRSGFGCQRTVLEWRYLSANRPKGESNLRL